MSKKLIITEKPSVARDFARVLGVSGRGNNCIENSDYVITWCVGHLVEMVYPEEYDIRYKKWRLEDLPFLPEKYKYDVIKRSADQYRTVTELLHRDDIDVVYWAGDSGKEGQTIEENIRNYGGVREGMTELRVWIDSQTDDEIRRGIAEARPMSDYALLGESGIMRAIEDYSLGINFSRALSVKYGRLINNAAGTTSYTAIAIGRVMTCVLGMVVRREREIRNFTETPFYRVVGSFSDAGINAEWRAVKGSRYFEAPALYKENGFKRQEDARGLIDSLAGKDALIDSIETGRSKKKAPLLFNLAELQAECSKRFKIDPSQTLLVAQELYEKKLTTYPRTDARVLTKAVAKEISRNLNGLKGLYGVSGFVDNILNNGLYKDIGKPPYTDDSKVTDHYAIIPTGQTGALSSLSSLAKNVYDLILRRFLAIFYPPAEYKTARLQIVVDGERFFATAKLLLSKGYLEVMGTFSERQKDDEDKADEDDDAGISREDFLKFVESAKEGDKISVQGYSIKEGKTSPPKRYTSGTLILAMENAGNLIEDEELRQQIRNTGIGTSATRAEIIKKLINIKYLNQSKKQIITPGVLGEMIYEIVDLSLPSLLNPEMTASWEKGLEGIYNGSVNGKEYREKLENYIRRETQKIIEKDLTQEILGNIAPMAGDKANAKGSSRGIPIGAKCPVCGGEMTTTSFGYGCSNYYDKDKKCSFAIGKIAGVELTKEQAVSLLNEGQTGTIKGFKSRTKKTFSAKLLLNKNEEGKPEVVFSFDGVEPDFLQDVSCPNCGGRIIKKSMGFGCENFRADDADSCRFFVGKICQKQISEKNVTELLKNGRTSLIKGFKSKRGKKFDASLSLSKDEDGKVTGLKFVFENEDETLENLKCPRCGKKIIKGHLGYRCEDYKREEGGCSFFVGKVAGLFLTKEDFTKLIETGSTDKISGFTSKKGTSFDARLRLDEQKNVVFNFD
ncbi:MAG: topoisomerase C-terminal repeat-containing protein [Butyrivibrio sp.]|nr:topoisomerase C-terminal repeat-containing protein [Butyrivibrio sp.]